MDLSQIVNGYIKELYNPRSQIQVPHDLKANTGQVFGNIKDIYKWHAEIFLKLLVQCTKKPTSFGKKMVGVEEKMISLYLKYCKSKPISDYLVTKHEQYFAKIQEKLGYNSNVKSHILLPIDRIFKYKPLFEAILKEVKDKGPEYEEELRKAIEVMKRICGAVNDAMVLNRLENFPEHIDTQGKILLYGPLWCTLESKRHSTSTMTKKLQVFLLEQSIIFSNIVGVSNQFDSQLYQYSYHMKVREMELSDLGIKFRLLHKGNKRSNSVVYSCHAENQGKTKVWINTIRKVLEDLINFVNDIENPAD